MLFIASSIALTMRRRCWPRPLGDGWQTSEPGPEAAALDSTAAPGNSLPSSAVAMRAVAALTPQKRAKCQYSSSFRGF